MKTGYGSEAGCPGLKRRVRIGGHGLVLLAFLSAAPTRSQDHTAYLLAHSPSPTDAVPSAAWDALPTAGGAFMGLASGGLAPLQTRFRIGYTPEALHIAVDCEEPEPEQLRATQADGGPIWTDDAVEIFVRPPDSTRYLHFLVNSRGARTGWSWEGAMQDRQDLPDELWSARATVGAKAWRVEVRLDLERLGQFPEDGEAWGLNVTRMIRTLSPPQASSWSKRLKHGYHEPEGFGRLVFSETLPPADLPSPEPLAATRSGDGLFLYSHPTQGLSLRQDRRVHRVLPIQGPDVAPVLLPGETLRFLYHSRRGDATGAPGIRFHDAAAETDLRWTTGTATAANADGTRILFVREGRIFERDAHTGAEVARSPAEWDECGFPADAGSGDAAFLFMARRDGVWGLYAADGAPDTVPQRLATMRDTPTGAPRADSRGRRIALSDGGRIRVLDRRNGDLRPLNRLGGFQTNPRWSADDSGLCFHLRTEPAARLGDVVYVALDAPDRLGVVFRNVDAAFDWRDGTVPHVDWTEPAPPESFFEAVADGLGDAFAKAGDSFQPALTFRLPGLDTPAELSFFDGETPVSVAVRRRESGLDGTQVWRLAVSDCGEPLTVVLSPDRGWIRLQSTLPTLEAALRAPMDVAGFPDRLAGDVALTLSADAGPWHVPPGAWMLTRSPGHPDLGWMFIGSDPAQTIRVRSVAASPVRDVRMALGPHPFWIAVQAADGDLQVQTVTDEANTGPGVAWTPSVSLLWRGVLLAPSLASRMFPGDVLAARTDRRAPLPEDMFPVGGQVLLYQFGRTAHTPAASVTRADVMWDALGVDAARRRMRDPACFRLPLAVRPVPSNLLDWLREGESDISSLAIRGIRIETEAARAFAVNLHDDVQAVLAALDARLESYRAACERLMPHRTALGLAPSVFAEVEANGGFAAVLANRPEIDPAEMEAYRGWLDGRQSPFRGFAVEAVEAAGGRIAWLCAARTVFQRLRFDAMQAIVANDAAGNAWEAVFEISNSVLRHFHDYELDADERKTMPAEIFGP